MVIGIAVFILSALLNLGIMFTPHRYTKLHTFQLFSHKLGKNPIKQTMVLENQYLERVQKEESFQWRNQSLPQLLLPESQLIETREASAPTYAHLNRHTPRV